MKFLSVKSIDTPVVISILLISIKTLFVHIIRGYDWGLFPTDATYSVFVFYIWLLAFYSAKENLQKARSTFLSTLDISNELFAEIKKKTNKVLVISKKPKAKSLISNLKHF